MKLFYSILFSIFTLPQINAQTIIKMEKVNGVFMMPCKVNGLMLKFIFDTGASDVSISLTEALFMLKNGYLDEKDLIGSQNYQIANGDIQEGTRIILRQIDIGAQKLYNVKASVLHSLTAPLLLRQSALSVLGKMEFDYANNTLKISNDKSDYANNNTHTSNEIYTFPGSSEDYLEKGNLKFNSEDYQGAIKDYTKVIDIGDLGTTDTVGFYKVKLEVAHLNRGLCKHKLEDYKGAIQDFTKAIELDSKYADAYCARGVSKNDLGDYYGAIQDYTKVIEIDPKCFAATHNRGFTKFNMKDYKGAIQDFSKAIELNPNAKTYHYRGLSKNELGDYYGAIQDYTKAIGLDPKASGAYHMRGNSKCHLKKYNEALQDYTKSIELYPKNADVYLNRGIAKYNLNDNKGACLDWSKAGELGSTEAYDNINKACK